MINRIVMCTAISLLFTSISAHAGMPVIVVGDATAAANQIETMAKWKIQLEQMASQLDKMKEQTSALTGSRGLGTVSNDPAFNNYLPNHWQGGYDALRNNGYAGLSGQSKTIYDSTHVYDSCAFITVADEKIACEARAAKAAQDKILSLTAFETAKNRLSQIEQLMNQINQTKDPKGIAELQARIGAEQANIQNEQIKLQTFAMASSAEDKLQEQRERELNARTWAARGGIEVKPITFNSR